jgi:A/G-specific adenine glycosylase
MRRERTPTPEAEAGRTFARDLCRWFASARRDLPWRRTRDPYAIWVSEIMLQQTRVETVIPYYQRFLARFPDVASLAGAELEEVLTAWSGLGYYRRARHLAAGAREVVLRYGGKLPSDPRELASLSGVGRYTAGAIASIAFDVQAPLVDGNVARVLARVFGIEDPVDAPRTMNKLYELAASLVPAERPGDFNQALMELGATICTPAPRCALCPVAKQCAALASGRERELPVTLKKKISPRLELTAALCEAGGRILMAKRPVTGIFADMWEPPLVEARGTRARALFAEAGIVLPARARAVGEHTHVLTHRVLEVSAVRATLGPKLPTSTFARKLLAMLGDEAASHDRKRAR